MTTETRMPERPRVGRRRRTAHRRLLLGLLVLMLVLPNALAWSVKDAFAGDLTDLSLEDLMAIEITTLSRKSQRTTDTAAAVFVITPEDIRRSGATNIPEALRMVPGLQVARISADQWAISSRGFNGFFSNKLLVLVDGRSVYNTIYAGVFWNIQDTVLEDIARIEVIRGPGASLWGANAVNGVINIVTKPAGDTQGALVSATGDTEGGLIGAARYGGAWGDSAHYRAYVKHVDRDGITNSTGEDNDEGWNVGRGGGRLDWQPSSQDSLTLLGDYFDSESKFVVSMPYNYRFYSEHRGHNLLGRWQRTFSPSSDLILQTYYSLSEMSLDIYSERVETFDLDFQHRFGLGRRQEIIWGLGWRQSESLLKGSIIFHFDPAQRTDQLYSLFAQDEIALWPERVSLIMGSKFEKNDYTGWETQPTARLRWTPGENHTLWAAVSRAVRTPTRLEWDATLTQISLIYLDGVYTIQANKQFTSEKLLAYEAGYRFHPKAGIGLDAALFYNAYDDLRIFDLGPSDGITANGMRGNTYGGELAVDWYPKAWWRLQAACSHLVMNLTDTYANDVISRFTEGQNPANQFSLRSNMDFAHGLELDLWLRYMDELADPNQTLEGYWNLDARIGWRASAHWSFDLVGQNLLDDMQMEFPQEFAGMESAQVERGVYFRVTFRF
ncbi:MAG: TonB-dependent receptor [Desulfatitalea sp.]|nr:TonB-dependent receptor [Desulfatitalea sp.]NNJ99494.1 TonB-dependent receptor [Desulfatitalea sp.]